MSSKLSGNANRKKRAAGLTLGSHRKPPGKAPRGKEWDVGCVVMLLRNLHATRGLCNGTRLIVTAQKKKVLICTILTGRKERIGKVVIIPRVKLHSAKGELPCTLTRLQFPVRVAFGMTINKSQGQTLPFVGVYLPRPVFGHGQLYVGLSRVGDPSCIKVLVVDTREQGRFEGRDGVWTVNIVYPEVLAEARRLLHASLAARTFSVCAECEEEEPAAVTPAPDLNADCEMADDDASADCEAPDPTVDETGGLATGDDVDAAAVDASIERHMLGPLRCAARVPTGALTRQQAWELAHAAEHVASTASEMVDPWD